MTGLLGVYQCPLSSLFQVIELQLRVSPCSGVPVQEIHGSLGFLQEETWGEALVMPVGCQEVTHKVTPYSKFQWNSRKAAWEPTESCNHLSLCVFLLCPCPSLHPSSPPSTEEFPWCVLRDPKHGILSLEHDCSFCLSPPPTTHSSPKPSLSPI